jgi:hypothetical protein
MIKGLFSLMTLLVVSMAVAQEETPIIIPGDGWTLEQRCVGNATTAPAITIIGLRSLSNFCMLKHQPSVVAFVDDKVDKS